MVFKVGNPRGIREGAHIINWPCTMPDPDNPEVRKQRGSMKTDRLWYEGDDFKRPVGMSDEGFNRLLAQGYIYEMEKVEVATQ